MPDESVGAPSEYADAEEMPGCVVGVVQAAYAVPYFLFRELPTLPLDGLVLAYSRGGVPAAFVLLLVMVGGAVGACWGMLSLF